MLDEQLIPQPEPPQKPENELTNTLTEFNRERNLELIVRLAFDLASQRGENEVKILVVGASHEEMVSLANNTRTLPTFRPEYKSFTSKLVGLNYNSEELPIRDRLSFTEKMKRLNYPPELLEKYQMVLHDLSLEPYLEEEFHAILINNVFVHYPFEMQKMILANAAQSLCPGGYFSMEEGRGFGYIGDKGTKRRNWVAATRELQDALETGELGFSKLSENKLENALGLTGDAFKQKHGSENYYRYTPQS